MRRKCCFHSDGLLLDLDSVKAPNAFVCCGLCWLSLSAQSVPKERSQSLAHLESCSDLRLVGNPLKGYWGSNVI